MRLRQLTPDDAEALKHIRDRALVEAPQAFSASIEEDAERGSDFYRERLAQAPERGFIYGVFDDSGIFGMAGVMVPPRFKMAHKAHIWGVFVAPQARGRGAGRALVEALIAHARRTPGVEALELTVNAEQAPAVSLYEALGFETWGRESDALRVGGVGFDELHMTLRF